MTDEKKVPLTQKAFDKLQQELEFLEGEDRQRIIKDIATARAHGDLSENAEYHAARDEQGQKEARIRQIRQMLENAEIITGDQDDSVAKPGKLVTIRHEGDDEPETYLLGRSPGETVGAQAPRGELKVELLEVRGA